MKIVACILSFLMGFCIAYMWIVPYEETTVEETETTETIETETKELEATKTKSAVTYGYTDQEISGTGTVIDSDVNAIVIETDTYSGAYDVSGILYSSTSLSKPVATVSGNLLTIAMPIDSSKTIYVYGYVPDNISTEPIINLLSGDLYMELLVGRSSSSSSTNITYWYPYTTLYLDGELTYKAYPQNGDTWGTASDQSYATSWTTGSYNLAVSLAILTEEKAQQYTSSWQITVDGTKYSTETGYIMEGFYNLYLRNKYMDETLYLYCRANSSSYTYLGVKIRNSYGLSMVLGQLTDFYDYMYTASVLNAYTKTIYVTTSGIIYVNGTKIEPTTSWTSYINNTTTKLIITLEEEEVYAEDITEAIEPLKETLEVIMTTKIWGEYGGFGTLCMLFIILTLGAFVIKSFIGG